MSDLLGRHSIEESLELIKYILSMMEREHSQGRKIRKYVPVMEYCLFEMRCCLPGQDKDRDTRRRDLALHDPYYGEGVTAVFD